ncbi:hypothetical protein OOK44_38625 [Streptomyces cellulosae]|uniref:hypothetical protein n=1 Tax=Streptomyces cellulosae TaxID=1968 RepID=UPI0022551380|nr:hypothetical protein [Streptomyces cellulosae]MCX4482294.1 hypothetical protein [Streptomyces cellulosae]WTB86768.1 hypothetical protein OIE99_00105 [Streptomyces cellulosae]WTB92858.1 hypothetical protein OIE99_33685 [Streptomyces cellulosae]WTB93246.1 hypothetical protein OIE99_33890 [Streptomyces cellulosae]
MIAFDLAWCRERARARALTDEDLAHLTGIPTTDWDQRLTPHTLTAAALFALARALGAAPESLLCTSGPARRPRQRPGRTAAAGTYTTVLHAALLQTGPVHPDDVASALGWPAHRLQRAAKELAVQFERHAGPHRLVHTDTTLHLDCAPGLLTAEQQQNLYEGGHTAASLSPGEASALTFLLHTAAHNLPHAVPAEQLPRLAGRRLLAPFGGEPAPHPDVLFALGLTDHLLPATAAACTPPPRGGAGR